MLIYILFLEYTSQQLILSAIRMNNPLNMSGSTQSHLFQVTLPYPRTLAYISSFIPNVENCMIVLIILLALTAIVTKSPRTHGHFTQFYSACKIHPIIPLNNVGFLGEEHVLIKKFHVHIDARCLINR